jgi:hypothetical protein
MHEKSVRKLSSAAKKRLGKASKAKRRGRKGDEEAKPKRKGRKSRKGRKARKASPAQHLKAIQGGVKLRKVSNEEKRYNQDRD